MNTLRLQVKLFENFVLKNPIWLASSHLTADESSLQKWSAYKPSAITLKTSSLVEGGDGKGTRTYVRLSERPSWFTDGPRHVELISGKRTRELIKHAKEMLPDSFIGVSILEDEDYEAFKQYTDGADFVELNTKYTGRLPESTDWPSYFEFHTQQHHELIEHIADFSNTFSPIPQFVKLSRDFPWLTPCQEFELFSNKLIELQSIGRKIGLVVANTPRLRVPPAALGSKIEDGQKRGIKPIELSDGVLCGEDLFLGTYNLIREIRLSGILPETIPIVASGGILSLRNVVDILFAGANAIQMCTAFEEKKFQYYAWIVGQMDRLLKNTKCGSTTRFCLKLRHEGETGLQRIREEVDNISIDFKEFVEREIRRQDTEILEILSGVLKEEACLVNLQPPTMFNHCIEEAKGYLHKPSSLRLPRFNYSQVQKNLSESNSCKEQQPKTILSLMPSLLGHAMLLSLGEYIWPKSKVWLFDDSSSVIKAMTEVDSWDFAIISLANIAKFKTVSLRSDLKPVPLGIIASGRYVLHSTANDINDIRELYHFGGPQSKACLDQLLDSFPALKKCPTNQGTITDLAQLLQMPQESTGIFVTDPIGQIYKKIVVNDEMKELASVPVYYCLLSSKQCVKSLGREGLSFIYEQLCSWRNDIEKDQKDIISLLIKSSILDRFIKYLQPL